MFVDGFGSGLWEQVGWDWVHALLDLDSETLESLFSLTLLLSHDFLVEVLLDVLWNGFGWDGFHGLVLDFALLVQLLFELLLSDWDFVFLLGAVSKTEGIGYSDVELFALGELLWSPYWGKFFFLPLNGLLFDRLLELFLITWGGVVTLRKFLLLFFSFFLFNARDLCLKIGDINLVLNLSGPASVGKELDNFLDVDKGLGLVEEPG